MEEKLKKVFVSVFGISEKSITDDTSIETLENWDSLSHMNLIVALEESFSVEFEEDEFVSMTSFRAIKEIIGSK